MIGAGPVGLAAIVTAGLYGAATIIAVDLDTNRPDKAREFGATHVVHSGNSDWKKQVLDLTDGQGVDERQHHPDPAQARGPEKSSGGRIRHPPLQLRLVHRGLRHLCEGRGDEGAQGPDHRLMNSRD